MSQTTRTGRNRVLSETQQLLQSFQEMLDKMREAETADVKPEGDGEVAADLAKRTLSGLYLNYGPGSSADPDADDAGVPSAERVRDELRLDIDGRYPQMTASGTIYSGLASRVDWIASLTPDGANKWKGLIWYKDGTTVTFPYTSVAIRIVRTNPLVAPRAIVTFSAGSTQRVRRHYRYRSPYYRPVEFEFDCAEGTTAATSYPTHSHPNRPATLPGETLTIDNVFRRCGFDVRASGGGNTVPMSGAGSNAHWSDAEMHDAMQAYWTRFANKPQWSLWVFFAALHEMGTGLGGIMFDDIGPNHRQGTAIFTGSFISQPPAGDAAPDAWVQRMQFWTACHEMGHAFNLAHSWQKSLGTPWIPLSDEPEARSFMNYPFRVAGDEPAFFSDFEFRFSDSELLFMRHAPMRFVQMGNADWFDHHGFQQPDAPVAPVLRLELRCNRDRARFEFLEPPMLELKLTNVSSQPQVVDERVLSDSAHLTVIIKKDGRPARQFLPFAHYCWQGSRIALLPGESIYESLFASAGRGGWEIAEPGHYTVQVALQYDGRTVTSNPLRLRVEPPNGREEELLAQDFYCEDVGRILAFDGSRYLEDGTDTLQEVADRLPDRRVALHCRVAVGLPLLEPYKMLETGETRRIRILAAREEAGEKELHLALRDRPREAAETLGHIDYNYYMTQESAWMAERGDREEAAEIQKQLAATLVARGVPNRIISDIEGRRELYERGPSAKGQAAAQT